MPRCPVCRKQCEPIKYEGVVIYNCGECGGHWLTQARLDVILDRREYEMPEPVKKKMIEIADASNTRERLMCMRCGREMVKEQFRHWPDIELDRCPKCNGLWLDRGELEKCQIYWEYLQDHGEEWENADVYARKALLEAELERHKAELRADVERAKQTRAAGGATDNPAAGIIYEIFGRR